MSLYRQPTTAVPLSFADIAQSLLRMNGDVRSRFAEELSRHLERKHVFLVNKGTTAFYLILKAASRLMPDKNEVIIPAYTIPNIVRVLKLLGLTPRLVDIDLSTFEFDLVAAKNVVSDKTLAAVPVHLFGFVQPPGKIRNALGGDIALIEDVCQCWGARPVADPHTLASFWSLCRGKSFSTYQGGVIGTDSDALAKEIEKDIEHLEEPSAFYNARCVLTMPPYALAMHPVFYGMLYPFISRFKSTGLHGAPTFSRYPASLAPFGLTIFKKMPFIEAKRREIGMRLYRALKGKREVIVPEIAEGTTPGFNHLPLVFRDPARRAYMEKKLWDRNIDTGRMYLRPVNMIFDFGYPQEPGTFPHAFTVAEGLLTVPTHPYLRNKDIEAIRDVLGELA